MTETCRCCKGAGVQRNDAGLLDRCPGCSGSGYWTKPEEPGDAPVPDPLPKPKPYYPDEHAMREFCDAHPSYCGQVTVLHGNRYVTEPVTGKRYLVMNDHAGN
jgi:hypothetical protein